MNLKDYEELVTSLLKERLQSCNIVFIIDALNQCDPLQDAEKLCTFVHDIVDENPQNSGCLFLARAIIRC